MSHIFRYAVERYTFDYMFKVDDDSFINPALLFDFLYKYIKPNYNDMNIGYYGGNVMSYNYGCNLISCPQTPSSILSFKRLQGGGANRDHL